MCMCVYITTTHMGTSKLDRLLFYDRVLETVVQSDSRSVVNRVIRFTTLDILYYLFLLSTIQTTHTADQLLMILSKIVCWHVGYQ